MENAFQEILSNITYYPLTTKYTVDETNLFFDIELKPDHFTSQSLEDLTRMIYYILKRYGKAIYVKIVNNKIDKFIPMKNPNYVSDWQKRVIGIDRMGYIDNDLEYVGLLDGFIVKPYEKVENFIWAYDMITELCKYRKISDSEFFINNDRNTPMVTKNRSNSDVGINHDFQLVDFYLPTRPHTVFSFNTSDRYLDLAFPTPKDFERISKYQFGIEDYRAMKWEEKENTFFFRGDSISSDVESALSNEFKSVSVELVSTLKKLSDKYNINAGITKFYLKLPIVKSSKISYQAENKNLYVEQQEENTVNTLYKSKFIIVADHVGINEELASLLFSGSCLLIIDSEWENWYSGLLQENVHFVKIKRDFSNIEEVMSWCVSHEDECRNIALNSRDFAFKMLSRNGVFDYLQCVINNGTRKILYNSNLYQIQGQFQIDTITDLLEHSLPFNSINKKELSNLIKKSRRSWSDNTAISLLLEHYDENMEENLYTVKEYSNMFDGINDAFVGLRCINDLCKEVPNFLYTVFAKTFNGKFYVFNEKVQNTTTIDVFVKNNPDKVAEILIQLYLALQLSLERCCFQHGNLIPDNVLIQELNKDFKITYRLDEKIWVINTRFIVIIKDYSNAKVLSNFSKFHNKTQRMFIGNYKEMEDGNKTKNIEDYLHVSGSRDAKLLFKKLGRKIHTKFHPKKVDEENLNPQPLELMRSSVTPADIRENNVKFGIIPPEKDTGVSADNPRLLYDKLVNESNPHDNTYQRIFKNQLPVEKSAAGNVIVQYEMTQSLNSTLADLNLNFKLDLVTSEKLKACIEFLKTFYNKAIEQSSATVLYSSDTSEDLWNIKMLLRRYMSQILHSNASKEILTQMAFVMMSVLKDSVKHGKNQTSAFYKKYKTSS